MRTEKKTKEHSWENQPAFCSYSNKRRSDCFPLYDQAFQRYGALDEKTERELLLNVNESLNAVCERSETALNYLLGMEKLQKYISSDFQNDSEHIFSLYDASEDSDDDKIYK